MKTPEKTTKCGFKYTINTSIPCVYVISKILVQVVRGTQDTLSTNATLPVQESGAISGLSVDKILLNCLLGCGSKELDPPITGLSKAV